MAEWRTIVGVVLSSIGVFLSFSSFVFLFYGNFHAAVWAFVSGILAGIDLHLLVLHHRKTLCNWHTVASISDFKILASVSFILGIAFTLWYIFMFFYYNLPILPIPDSYQIAAVWSLMTVKWALGLWFTAHHLANKIQESYNLLLAPQNHYNGRFSHYW